MLRTEGLLPGPLKAARIHLPERDRLREARPFEPVAIEMVLVICFSNLDQADGIEFTKFCICCCISLAGKRTR